MVLNVLLPPHLEGQYCFFSVYKHRALKLVGLIIDLIHLMVWVCHLTVGIFHRKRQNYQQYAMATSTGTSATKHSGLCRSLM